MVELEEAQKDVHRKAHIENGRTNAHTYTPTNEGRNRRRGGPRFSFLSTSATDKGHCGGSYCGGLTYAHAYSYVHTYTYVHS